MSRIFDALLRSEAERSGVDVSTLSGATEVLEQAERHAVTENGAPAGNGSAPVAEFGFRGSEAAEAAAVSPAGAGLRNGEKRSDAYRDVQVLAPPLDLNGRLVSLGDQDGPAAEAFRFLGVRLRHMRRDRVLKKLLITSSIPQEGKSLVAANLACTLSLRSQQRAVLLEGDFRRPSLTQLFGLQGKPGICEWLREENELSESMYRLPNTPLWLLPAGSSSGNYVELLQSGRIARLVEEVAGAFDWVVIDSPPILPLADTSIWARLADGILLVVRRGRTEKKQLQKGLEAMERDKLIGAVLNSSSSSPHGDYYYTRSKAEASAP